METDGISAWDVHITVKIIRIPHVWPHQRFPGEYVSLLYLVLFCWYICFNIKKRLIRLHQLVNIIIKVRVKNIYQFLTPIAWFRTASPTRISCMVSYHLCLQFAVWLVAVIDEMCGVTWIFWDTYMLLQNSDKLDYQKHICTWSIVECDGLVKRDINPYWSRNPLLTLLSRSRPMTTAAGWAQTFGKHNPTIWWLLPLGNLVIQWLSPLWFLSSPGKYTAADGLI